MGLPDLSLQVFGDLCLTCGAQTGGAVFDNVAIDLLRNTCCRCAFTFGVWEDVQPSQIALGDKFQRVFEMGIRFGREAGNNMSFAVATCAPLR
jgi:hypothetical protein